MKNRLLIFIAGLLIVTSSFAQEEDQVEKYHKDAEDLISFLEYIFNSLGNPEITVADKDVIVSESYLKAFDNAKVQIEDDLIADREVVTNKDVQAYLKDIDFFFKSATFELRIEEIRQGINEKNELFFTVKVNRRLQAIGLKGDSVNNSLVRYVELNVNPEQKDLKIASIYTSKLGEKEELIRWWISLSPSWKTILGKNLYVSEVYQLNDVSVVNDSTYFIGGQKADPKVYNVFGAIKKATEITELDLSGNREVIGIEPLNELTNLKKLVIAKTGISSLFPVRNLTTLEVLDCSNTIIDDINPLRYSTNLQELTISNTNVLDIKVVGAFNKLKTFHAANLQIDTLDVLASCKTLQNVSLEGNKKAADFTFLKGLTKLKKLNLKGTRFSDETLLTTLTSLEELDLSNTAVDEFSDLSMLAALQKISFEGTKVGHLAPLLKTPVKSIYCDGSAISKAEVQSFVLERPDAKIIFESERLVKWWENMDAVWKKLVFNRLELKEKPNSELLHEIIRVDSINIRGHKEIKDITPISEVLFLKNLNISKTGVTNLGPIKDQAYLQRIDFSNTGVEDLTPLAGKNHLERILGKSSKVSDIAPLEGLINLAYLDFDSTQVRDVSVINSLPSFKMGYFDNTNVTDEDVVELDYDGESAILVYKTERLRSWWGQLDDEWQDIFRKFQNVDKTPQREELHKLTGLKKFIVKSILIKDISVMQEFVRLRELEFNDTQISNISPLGKMSKLEVLNCARNPIEDISPLAQMPGLKVFLADNTQIEDIDPIAGLTSLEELKISNTNVRDIGPLEGLANLQVLEFSNTRVKNIKPIMGLTNLKSLRCFNNSINEKRIDEFKAAHPNCEVVFY